ncbi:MAG: hypothetical protein ACJ74G_20670 [Blastocatellia bacterium]
MSNRDITGQVHPEAGHAVDQNRRRWGSLRPRHPASVWGWLIWVLFVLFLYLFVAYVLVPWYQPVPTDVPPPVPNSNTRRV